VVSGSPGLKDSCAEISASAKAELLFNLWQGLEPSAIFKTWFSALGIANSREVSC
jgi:hypothetical protein